MKYEVISSNSSGNCYLFDDELIIDIGVGYKQIEYIKPKFVLLTHIHGDHFNITTIRKLYVNTNCIFVVPVWLTDKMTFKDRIIEVDFGKVYQLDDWKIALIKAYHDVPNCGYRLMKDNHKHIHITDTNSLDGVEALNYNSATIEANHEINKALELINKAKEKEEYSHLMNAIKYHLSVDKTMDFLAKNEIKNFTLCHIGDSTKKEVLEYIDE